MNRRSRLMTRLMTPDNECLLGGLLSENLKNLRQSIPPYKLNCDSYSWPEGNEEVCY